MGTDTFGPLYLHVLAASPNVSPVPQSVNSVGPKFAKFTRIQFPDHLSWALKLSWLVLALISAVLSYVCFRRYRLLWLASIPAEGEA